MCTSYIERLTENRTLSRPVRPRGFAATSFQDQRNNYGWEHGAPTIPFALIELFLPEPCHPSCSESEKQRPPLRLQGRPGLHNEENFYDVRAKVRIDGVVGRGVKLLLE